MTPASATVARGVAFGASLFAAAGACAESWDKLKADWSGQGVTPSLLYQGAAAAIPHGGVRQGATYIGNLHLQIELDGGPLMGVPGLSLYVDGVDIHGGQPSGFAGDAQGVSNLAGPPRFELYESWLQYNLFDDRLSALVGRYDISNEFYRVQSAFLFLNGSFGIGPEFAFTGNGGPSTFPETSFGARFAVSVAPSLLWRTAVLDGAPVRRPDGTTGIFRRGDGALLVSEVNFLDVPGDGNRPRKTEFRRGPTIDEGDYDTKIVLGGWHYTARFPDLSEVDASGAPVQHRGSSGSYLLADQVLYRGPGEEGGKLAGFVQAGLGDPRVDRFGSYIGAGLVASGLVPDRPNDQLGASVAVARNGGHYLDAQRDRGTSADRAEIAIEATYLAQIFRWLILQPDAQYVVHPNTDPTVPNALVLQLQVQITF